jgi:hypothetical protein
MTADLLGVFRGIRYRVLRIGSAGARLAHPLAHGSAAGPSSRSTMRLLMSGSGMYFI